MGPPLAREKGSRAERRELAGTRCVRPGAGLAARRPAGSGKVPSAGRVQGRLSIRPGPRARRGRRGGRGKFAATSPARSRSAPGRSTWSRELESGGARRVEPSPAVGRWVLTGSRGERGRGGGPGWGPQGAPPSPGAGTAPGRPGVCSGSAPRGPGPGTAAFAGRSAAQAPGPAGHGFAQPRGEGRVGQRLLRAVTGACRDPETHWAGRPGSRRSHGEGLGALARCFGPDRH